MADILDMLKKGYQATIPVNARFLASSILSPSVKTEQDLSEKELEALRQTYLNSQYRSGNADVSSIQGLLSNLKGVSPNEKVESQFGAGFVSPETEMILARQQMSPTIQYSDYPVSKEYDKYGVGNMPISASFTQPGYALSTAIGRSQYYTDPQGNVRVKDVYDFPKGSNMEDYGGWSYPFKVAHGIGEKLSNKMPVDINLGLIGNKKKK
jgi:hypothetical protein